MFFLLTVPELFLTFSLRKVSYLFILINHLLTFLSDMFFILIPQTSPLEVCSGLLPKRV